MKYTKKIIAISFLVVSLAAIVFGALFFYGVLWFVRPEKMGYPVKGVDVSSWQGEVDWQLLSSQGIRFAFIKATEGSSHTDSHFCFNIEASMKHSITSGAYHFFSSESPGRTQAENFINAVSPYEIDLPPVLDFEIPESKAGHREEIVREARDFLQLLEEHFGVKPIIYTTYASYNAYLSDGFGEYPLWFRDLFREPDPGGDAHWLFWQYNNRGRLDGIDIIDREQKYVDLNVFNGSLHEFESYVEELSRQLRRN